MTTFAFACALTGGKARSRPTNTSDNAAQLSRTSFLITGASQNPRFYRAAANRPHRHAALRESWNAKTAKAAETRKGVTATRPAGGCAGSLREPGRAGLVPH